MSSFIYLLIEGWTDPLVACTLHLDTVTSSWKTDFPFASGHDLIAAIISIPMPFTPSTNSPIVTSGT